MSEFTSLPIPAAPIGDHAAAVRAAILATSDDFEEADVLTGTPHAASIVATGSEPLRIAFGGDSLMALGPVQPGPLMGIVGSFGTGLVATTGTVTPVSSFANWITGASTSVAVGATAEFSCGLPAPAPIRGTRFTLYYIREPGAGSFTIEYQANNTGSWVSLGTVNAAHTSRAGAVFTGTLPLSANPAYKVRITSVTTGPVIVIMAGIYHHEGCGVIHFAPQCFAVGGVDFPNPLTTATAITDPILADADIDLFLHCWADGAAVYGTSGDFQTLYDRHVAVNPDVDYVLISPHWLTNDDPANVAVVRETAAAQRAFALRNKQSFINVLGAFKAHAWATAQGLMADAAHLNDAGGMYRNLVVWQRLPIFQMPLGALPGLFLENTLYPYARILGGDNTPTIDPAVIYEGIPLFAEGQISIADSTSTVGTRNFAIKNTAGEVFFTVNNSSSMIFGISSLTGAHPGANNLMLGGRGNFRWRVGATGLQTSERSVSADATFGTDDHTIIVTSGSPNITLPTPTATNASTSATHNIAAGIDGKIFILVNQGAGTPTLVGTVSGVTNPTVAAQTTWVMQSTGSAWVLVGKFSNAP